MRAISYSKDISHTSPLRSWAVLVDGDIPRETFARLQSHPRYREITRKFMTDTLELAARDRSIDGIFKDMGRYGAALWATYLHLTGGLTLPRLKEICARSKMLSPGRARALLIYLQLLGYVKALPKTARGPTQYAPSVALVAALKAQSRIGLEVLAAVDPHFQTVIDHLDEPDVFNGLIVKFGEGAINAAVAVDQNAPFWQIFLMRNAGMQMLHCLILADENPDAKTPEKKNIVSIAGMAQRLKVARSHVLRVLRLAEKEKLLRRFKDGTIQLSEELRFQADQTLSLQIIGYALCGAFAYEYIDDDTKRSARPVSEVKKAADNSFAAARAEPIPS